MSEEQLQYYTPGNEPITIDELFRQIGEKEVDLQRKKQAINKLTKQIEILLKSNEELNNKISVYEKENSLIKDTSTPEATFTVQ